VVIRFESPDRTDDHRVWAIVGELIFWLNKGDGGCAGRISALYDELEGVCFALPGVLHELASASGIAGRSVLALLASSHKEASGAPFIGASNDLKPSPPCSTIGWRLLKIG
jgi:hypothetical protein